LLRKEDKNNKFIISNESNTKFLDCSKYVQVCKAIHANNNNFVYTHTNESVVANSKIVYNAKDKSFSLIAICEIHANTEILHDQGQSYEQ
jgi:hypothetical protein